MCPRSTRISRFLIARVWPNPLQSIAILQPAGHKMASAPNFPHFHGVCSANLLWQPCWTSIVAALLKSAEALTPFLNFAVGCHALGFPKKTFKFNKLEEFTDFYTFSHILSLISFGIEAYVHIFLIGFWVHIIKCVVFFQSQSLYCNNLG